VKYCDICILPSTRPGIRFDPLTNKCSCSFSRGQSRKSAREREVEFLELVKDVKSHNKNWDCVIPVSGGKDSTWQTLKALEYGLKPLCITWKTPGRTELGQRNLQNLINLGVDHFDVSISPKIERELTKQAFLRIGIPALPMHMALFSIPTRIAISLNIPLILWGENSAFEYGGTDEDANSFTLTKDWLTRYGVNGGTVIEDWISKKLSKKDLFLYTYPDDAEITEAGIKAVFLGYFFDWSPREAYKVAASKGFKAADKPVVGSFNFADVDEAFIMTVHHWLKWYKFGITRDWDNLSLDIRANKISREKAIKILKEKGEDIPLKEIQSFCNYIQISTSDFFDAAEKFRNPDIWVFDPSLNHFKIRNFLIDDFDWRNK